MTGTRHCGGAGDPEPADQTDDAGPEPPIPTEAPAPAAPDETDETDETDDRWWDAGGAELGGEDGDDSKGGDGLAAAEDVDAAGDAEDDDAAEPAELFEGERLQKVLARAGIGSRRVAEDLIDAGRVQVNGRVAVLGRRVDPEQDVVAVDGTPIGTAQGLAYRLLNKPCGVVATAEDPQGRPTVVQLVPTEPRVVPVGRLDVDTEGLLLLTNDGQLHHRLTHPSFGVEKEYLAEVEGELWPKDLRKLRSGVELEDGMTAPAKASSPAPNLLKLTLHEGRNRQVRRMCEAIGHPVVRLVRTRIGPLVDGSLPPGSWRDLTRDEVRSLERAVVEEKAVNAGRWRPGDVTGRRNR